MKSPVRKEIHHKPWVQASKIRELICNAARNGSGTRPAHNEASISATSARGGG
jgi:hypothetical protein